MVQILPIGSVVSLKDNNDTPVMIVGRAALYQVQKNKVGYFDYSGVLYPDGIESDQRFLFFNQEDIEEILFEGYRNATEEEFASQYDELVKTSGYPKLTSDQL